ncbi:MAG: hypothetical protein LBE55_03910 [Clostridiales bacterium]|jgi:hypothetical protein|nr:hypothetical protein [Clostridiales bacterium]
MKLLKKRGFAWPLAVLIMILSVVAGAYTSFAGMRGTAMAAFEREMMPIVNQAMIYAHDMQSVAQNYLSSADITTIGISRIVAEIQATDNPAEIYRQFTLLNRGAWEIHDRIIGQNMEISDTNRTLLTNSHADFLQMDLILSHAGYNNTAGAFNDNLARGLGFLVRPVIGEMPRFD